VGEFEVAIRDRPFRDFLNDRLSAAVSACCPGFVESKSLARAGGFTRRCKLADGRAVYIFMTTVPQRERFMAMSRSLLNAAG